MEEMNCCKFHETGGPLNVSCSGDEYHWRDSEDKIVNALDQLHRAACDVLNLWDHTGTNMIDGYPKCLPSWDEFTAELAGWYLEQKRIRTQRYVLTSGDYNGEISYTEFVQANAEALDESQIAEVKELGLGECIVFGGGTAGESVLRRVK